MKKKVQLLKGKVKKKIYKFVKANGLSAIVAAIVVFVFVKVSDDWTQILDWTFFSSILFAIVLEGIATLLSNIIMNRLEDSVKLTTDYDRLMKKYRTNWYEYKGEKFPIIHEAWIDGGKIEIHDTPEMYVLPECIKDNFDDIITAHDTSTTFNSYMVRVKDWNVKDGVLHMYTTRTTFYNSLVTNRAMDYKWKNRLSVRDELAFGPFIRTLKESNLSNHLGYNGFVKTADGYIGFVKRSDVVSIGKKTYGNSIGASLKTVHALDDNNVFTLKGLHKAIIKEIKDEVGLEEKDLIDTRLENIILAAYRDFVEGGKPQFMFWVKSNKDKDEVEKIIKAHRSKKNIKNAIMDGEKWLWIKEDEIMNLKLTANSMEYRNKVYTMMPSAAACTGMLIEYLNRERKS